MTDGSTWIRWPNDAYIAVVLNVAWEAWPPDLGSALSHQNSDRRPVPAGATFDRDMRTVYDHAFAETGGVQRLLDVFEEQEVPATFLVSGQTIETFPALARKVAAKGHELASENWVHEYAVMQTEEEERASIKATVEAFEAVLGSRPEGYTTPGGMTSPHTYRLVTELGYRWVGSLRNTDVPFVMNVGGSRLVGMNNHNLTDYASYKRGGWTPRQCAEMVRDEFDLLYREGRRGRPKLLAYGSHPFLARGMRGKLLGDIVEYLRGHPRVWFARQRDIASWMLEQFPEVGLRELYPESAVASVRVHRLDFEP